MFSLPSSSKQSLDGSSSFLLCLNASTSLSAKLENEARGAQKRGIAGISEADKSRHLLMEPAQLRSTNLPSHSMP